jgi:CubicO group peptidase (beta-lactamase class C family)
VADLQDRIQSFIDERSSSGADQGIQVAVYHDGEQVVDAVSGLADPASGRPVDSGTVFYNWSIGKGATATCAHVLAEQGLLDYRTPVAELWPEFAAGGKQAITVRQLLDHSAGLTRMPAATTPELICDWDRMCAWLAAAEPEWEPGTKVGYHAYTFGWLVGEVVRRASGKPISRVLAEDVAGPIGMAGELWFGIPESEWHRLATLEDGPGWDQIVASIPDDSPMFSVSPKPVFVDAAFGSRPDILAADIPAGAKVSARGIARMYAALMGEVDGVRLIPEERMRAVIAVSSRGEDQVYGNPSAWGLGYAKGLPEADLDATGTWFGMTGAGGSAAYADPVTRTAVAVTRNRMGFEMETATKVIGIVLETLD